MNLLGGQMVAPAAEVDRDLEQVLLGLADGSYVLSTPDGAVAESGIGVVGLLGAPADALVGRPIAEVLVAGADAQTSGELQQMLRAPSSDPATRRTFSARCADGATRSLQFVVVCVPLALGWEFTSLLTELRSRDAGTWHPEELRLRHGRALEAVEGVVLRGTQPDPEARLAGILIVVRDVDAAPLTRADVDRRMAEQRNAARIAAAEAARRIDSAAGRLASDTDEEEPADQAAGLEDLVERARILRERVEDAERDAAVATQERDEALARLADAEAERDAAQAELADRGHDAEGRAAQLASELAEARARLEARGHELASARAEAQAAQAETQAAGATAQAAQAGARAAQADAAAVRDELSALRAHAASVGGDTQSAQAEAGAARAEADAARADAEAVRAELDSARAELTSLRGENALARGEASAVRAQLQSTHGELHGSRAELDATRAELDAVGAQLDSARMELEAQAGELERTRVELETTRAAAEAIRAEFAFEPVEPVEQAGRPAADARPAQRTPWSVPVPAATAAADAQAQPGAPRPELPAVGAGEAAALISLDGRFRRLDEAFCSLLGCREEDLRAARWPSIIDRENLRAHQDVARALKAGEIQSAEVETVYMHAQGLLVPIAGTISIHRPPPGGEPHFLFRADVSRTAGVPGVR